MPTLNYSPKISRLLAGFMIFLQASCTMPSPSHDLHSRLQSQSVAYIPLTPEIPVSLDLETKSRAEGAFEKGALGAIEFAAQGTCTGSDVCGLFLLSALALGFIAGGIVGALVATPEERAKDMESAINKGVSSIAIQLDLPQKILSEIKSHEWIKLNLIDESGFHNKIITKEQRLCDGLRQAGYSFAMQTQINHFEFIGGEGDDPEVFFRLGVQTTLIDLESLEKVFEDTFYHVSRKMQFSRWASRDSKMFKDLLERNVTSLAREIVDKLFLQTDLPVSSGMWRLPGSKGYGCCWLCPISPPYEVDYWPRVQLQYPVVESLTPALEWESADTMFKQKKTNKSEGPEGRVTYDLRIWEAFNDIKHDLVYERTSLDYPKHQVENPLKSQHRYFWSFRACVSEEGGKSCTPWASSMVPSAPPALVEFDYCGSGVIQDQNYYRFGTTRWH